MTIPNSNPLSYVGKEPVKRTFVRNRAPTAADNKSFAVGDTWIDTAAQTAYVKTSGSATAANWASITSAGGGGSGLTWNPGTGSLTMAANEAYTVIAGSATLTLPAVAAVGDRVLVTLSGGTSWIIGQGAGQSVIVNASTTTVGVAGTITSTGDGQVIQIDCVTANTGWQVTSLIGNPTVV